MVVEESGGATGPFPGFLSLACHARSRRERHGGMRGGSSAEGPTKDLRPGLPGGLLKTNLISGVTQSAAPAPSALMTDSGLSTAATRRCVARSLIQSHGAARNDSCRQCGSVPARSRRVFVSSSPCASLRISSRSTRQRLTGERSPLLTTSQRFWLGGTACLSLTTCTDDAMSTSRNCPSREPAERTPNNRERHPRCLAAEWGGVSDYERLKWPRQPRGYPMLHQVTPSRFGVSLPGDGR